VSVESVHPVRPSTSRSTNRGSNLDDVRRRNLSIVLRLVHVRGRLSRADLVRETGLNRSTIAAIVTDLERRCLVVESEPQGAKSIGRPSFLITPSESTIAVAVNPELDAVTIGLVALGGNVLRSVRFENVRIPSAQEVVNVISAVLAGMAPELAGMHHTVGVGLAVPGLVRAGDGTVVVAPHLEWRDEPLAQMVAAVTGYPAWAANDASCGAVAESLFGVGRGHDDIVYLNGGASGIGGGVIVGGVPMGGASGFAGEVGHTLVNSAGAPCHCGASGCLETEVTRAEMLGTLGLEDADVAQLDDRLAAAYATDPAVRAVVARHVEYLGIALRNIVNVFNPSLVVLGGFLGALQRVAGDELAEIVRRTALSGPRAGVEIVSTSLGRDTLLVGAAELAFAGVLADPTSVEPAAAGDELVPVEG
jgi:predicted NBD/HSP70 family sugar kinase